LTGVKKRKDMQTIQRKQRSGQLVWLGVEASQNKEARQIWGGNVQLMLGKGQRQREGARSIDKSVEAGLKGPPGKKGVLRHKKRVSK